MLGIARRRDDPAQRARTSVSCAFAGAQGLSDERAGSGAADAPDPAGRIVVPGGSAGPWPEDPDAVPDWIVLANRRRQDLGLPAVPYRTKREFDAAVALVLQIEGAKSAKRIAPDEASRKFVAGLDRCVSFTDEALSAAYRSFCREQRVECAENFFRAALKRHDCVSREETVTYKPRRSRNVLWVIKPVSPSVSGGNHAVSNGA